MRIAIFIDPNCPKLTVGAYSQTYRDMFQAVCARFDDVVLLTEGQSVKDLDADVILVYDIHSSHHIEISGMAEHPAVKYSYMNDPHQKEFKGAYRNGPAVHKLGAQQRIDRANDRCIDFIICPYKNGYYDHLAPCMGPYPEKRLFWFPPAPSILRFPQALCARPLNERKHRILGNGIMHGGAGAYDFRKWAFAQKNTYYVKHAIDRPGVPKGAAYAKLLAQFTGALALCDWYVVPKYLEIPLAGCVCFAQNQEDYREMGFLDGRNCRILDNQYQYDHNTRGFLECPDLSGYQKIADAGRKLVEENWTAECFADALYKHASERVNQT